MSGTTQHWQLLNELYGDVKRARGPFLYTQSGTRLTDLYQDDGRAILGWGAGGALTAMKRLIERGATGSYRTAQAHRLCVAVSALFAQKPPAPQLEVIPFASEADCLECARTIAHQQVHLWRPWAQEAASALEAGCAAFCPPLPWGGGVYLVAAQAGTLARCLAGEPPARAITLAPPVQAALARAVWDLLAALATRCEQQWFLYDAALVRYWRREGPYLYPKVPQQAYSAFWEHCLRLGIVANPRFEGASIVPLGANRGVFEVLRKSPFDC